MHPTALGWKVRRVRPSTHHSACRATRGIFIKCDMRWWEISAAGIALLTSGCIDLSAISTNELWIVNESSVAVSGIACVDENPCIDYHLPAGKFVRTGLTLCAAGADRIGISVQGDGLINVP